VSDVGGQAHAVETCVFVDLEGMVWEGADFAPWCMGTAGQEYLFLIPLVKGD
jgi:hypothetical protein